MKVLTMKALPTRAGLAKRFQARNEELYLKVVLPLVSIKVQDCCFRCCYTYNNLPSI